MIRPRKRIVVIGGGVSGLTAAYELTRSPELRERHSVTVAQIGFRLGGKLASGRNLRMGARNEEHGLHVWFGFYDNAFALWREVHERWKPPIGSPIHGFGDVLEPCRFAPFGRPAVDAYGAWTVLFPENSARPGDGQPARPSQIIEHLLDAVRTRLRMLWTDLRAAPSASPEPMPADRRGRPLPSRIDSTIATIVDLLQPTWRARSTGLDRNLADRIHALLVAAAQAVLPVVEQATRANPVLRTHVHHTLDFCFAALRALFDPRFRVSDDWNLDRLNHLELRELLQTCGLARETSEDFVLIRGCYDAFFQYEEGDVSRPNFEAGTALRIALRALLLYRGSAFWLFNYGAGECLVSPLYRVLRDQGVDFRFFHQLVDLEISPDRRTVERLWFVEQARPIAEYQPTFELDGLECWPTEPRWEQLIDGEVLRERGDTLESPSAGACGPRRAWVRGEDFDDVVLALPLGAMTPRGGAPSPVAALAAHNPAFARLCEGLNLVPSIAAQIWLDRPLRPPDSLRPAMLSWAYPWDIWADMSPTLAHEAWPGPRRPRSTLYLCGTTTSELPRAHDREQTRLEETRAASEALTKQLRRHGPRMFPTLREEAGDFAESSLLAQLVRINADPSDLCDGATVGSSSLRLEADSSGLDNLVLCGTWTRTGLNTTCVEAAVMAGMAAARALAPDARAPQADRFMQAGARQDRG